MDLWLSGRICWKFGELFGVLGRRQKTRESLAFRLENAIEPGNNDFVFNCDGLQIAMSWKFVSSKKK